MCVTGTSYERIDAESIDKDVVRVLGIGEEFGNDVEIGSNVTCNIEQMLDRETNPAIANKTLSIERRA